MTVLDYRSAPATEPNTAKPSGHWLGWAVYLAMSWTWCIGMFLPVLLVRDYGIWGFVVFAVPNVLGAAAMGWVIRSASLSSQIVRSHHVACRLFSLVTIAFHVFFIIWIFGPLPGSPVLLLPAAIVLAMLIHLTGRWGNSWHIGVAALTLVLSVSLFGIGYVARQLPRIPFGQDWDPTNLAGLALVSFFGFVLCPYLDLTFHRVRQHTSPSNARLAYAIGFGVFFLAMILFTLAYSGWLHDYFDYKLIPRLVVVVIGIHLIAQSALTMGLHARELTGQSGLALFLWGAVFLSFVVLIMYPRLIFGNHRYSPDFHHGESIYRFVMGFYALFFPTYVWLCMIPSPRSRPSQRSLIVFTIAVMIASPLFWMGFIKGKMIWLLPGLAVLLLARLLVPRVARQIRQ